MEIVETEPTLAPPKCPPFLQTLKQNKVPFFRRELQTLQVNIGKLCNQACLHCHVEAGPKKTAENMNKETIDQLIKLIDATSSIRTVDITGGAPEMNANFRYFVSELASRKIKVIDRCNLTVLSLKGQEDTHQFLADHKVEVVASLPCYSKDNVDKQRGRGTFGQSINGLKKLNQVGYGKEGTGLILNLVYNPVGPYLPPSQAKLQNDYKAELKELFDIEFNQLFTITNMPVKRFLWDLERRGELDAYMHLLLENFNSGAAENIMCRDLVSVSWDGRLYDCDFNQMLDMDLGGKPISVMQLDSFEVLNNKLIRFDDHCYGCTAGAGSSCGGSLTESSL